MYLGLGQYCGTVTLPVSCRRKLELLDQNDVLPAVVKAKGAMLRLVPGAKPTVLCTSGWVDAFRKQYASPLQFRGCRHRRASAERQGTRSSSTYDLRLVQVPLPRL